MNEKTGEMSYGFASNLRDALPNASFMGFTGTPIEKTHANTRAVFGDYISIYDIQRAVADKATVPIYYESRISKLSLNAAELPKLDAEFEEITEGEELTKKEKLKTKWAALEALVGDPKRIALVAADLVAHFEKRVEPMDGKAMIVCMSRAGAGSGVEGIGRVGAEIPLPRAAGNLDILFGRLHRKPLCVGGPGAAGRVSGKRTASQRVAKA